MAKLPPLTEPTTVTGTPALSVALRVALVVAFVRTLTSAQAVTIGLVAPNAGLGADRTVARSAIARQATAKAAGASREVPRLKRAGCALFRGISRNLVRDGSSMVTIRRKGHDPTGPPQTLPIGATEGPPVPSPRLVAVSTDGRSVTPDEAPPG